MRNLFIIALLLLGAFMAGWFKVNRDGDRTTIEINRSEIRNDSAEVIDRGREFLHRHDEQATGIHLPQNAVGQQWTPDQVASQAGQWAQGVIQSGYQAPTNQQPMVQPQHR